MSPSLYRKLADLAVSGLNLQPGQFVEIRADSGMWDCIEAVSLAVEKAGAVPCLNVTSIAHEAERIRTLPIDWLRRPSPFLLDLATRADAAIVIERDWRQLTESCPGRATRGVEPGYWSAATPTGIQTRSQLHDRAPGRGATR